MTRVFCATLYVGDVIVDHHEYQRADVPAGA